MEYNYDLVVIGGGPGGYMAALAAAKAGMKTALVEKDTLGGTCLNRGCIPTKALLHSAGLYKKLQEGEPFGICCQGADYDLEAIYSYKDRVVGELAAGIAGLLQKAKIAVYKGEGQIAAEHRVHVSLDGGAAQELTADNILVATGSVPAMPPIAGIDLPGVYSSDGFLDANVIAGWEKAAKRLVIIGGGVIGMEFASIFNAFGYEVTVLEALDRLLANMDKEISQNTKMIYKKRGIDFHTGARVSEIVGGHGGEDAPLYCRYVEKEQEHRVAADHILVAVGRKSCGAKVFGELAAPKSHQGCLLVNEHFQTDYPSIYAIGDAIGGLMLAHAATAQGLAAVNHMGGAAPSCDTHVIPACVYTDPEIACVGLTADMAKAKGQETVVKKYPMSANGKTVLARGDRGFIKIVADAHTHQILGAQLMCARATDMIGELCAAVVNHLTLEQMAMAVHPHPTYGEGLWEAFRL